MNLELNIVIGRLSNEWMFICVFIDELGSTLLPIDFVFNLRSVIMLDHDR